jgi:ABC-2 type transport system ATP-binding protein
MQKSEAAPMQIEARGVTKRFGALEALSAVDLTVGRGGRVSLVGPNGSGKTTLMRAILGLVAVEGEVLLDGEPASASRMKRAQEVVYVPQVAPRIAAPVAAMVAIFTKMRGVDARRVAEQARAFGLDVEAIAKRPFYALSGGMKQKLLLSLALTSDATLLVLDEPTASLDAASRQLCFERIAELGDDITLVLCSHRIEEVRGLTDRVAALRDGKAVFDGSVSEYLAAGGLCVIEVLPASESVEAALTAQGFSRGVHGWWRRTLAQDDKIEVVARLLDAAPGGVANLSIRDLDLGADSEE